jgi:hypothetical protein
MASDAQLWASAYLERMREAADTPEKWARYTQELDKAQSDPDFMQHLASMQQHGKFQSGGFGWGLDAALAGMSLLPATAPFARPLRAVAAAGFPALGALRLAEGTERSARGEPGGGETLWGGADVLGGLYALRRAIPGLRGIAPALKAGKRIADKGIGGTGKIGHFMGEPIPTERVVPPAGSRSWEDATGFGGEGPPIPPPRQKPPEPGAPDVSQGPFGRQPPKSGVGFDEAMGGRSYRPGRDPYPGDARRQAEWNDLRTRAQSPEASEADQQAWAEVVAQQQGPRAGSPELFNQQRARQRAWAKAQDQDDPFRVRDELPMAPGGPFPFPTPGRPIAPNLRTPPPPQTTSPPTPPVGGPSPTQLSLLDQPTGETQPSFLRALGTQLGKRGDETRLAALHNQLEAAEALEAQGIFGSRGKKSDDIRREIKRLEGGQRSAFARPLVQTESPISSIRDDDPEAFYEKVRSVSEPPPKVHPATVRTADVAPDPDPKKEAALIVDDIALVLSDKDLC